MTEAHQLPKPGELIGAKYQVERLLGLGGMGAVYEASHRVTGKRFALKLLLPELTIREDVVKRFIREAQVAGRFQHPNVVEVYDIGEHAESFFMVMELLRGESLALRLERELRLPVAEACGLVMEALDGVAAAHAAGIIHRDLKPANIFLCETRSGSFAKVLDFGISKLNDVPGIPKATTTDTGTVMGTPFYMAPEQLRSRGVDHRVDIYALGVTLYQLVSGRQPYIADNYPDLVIKIWTETPPALELLAPETPLELASAVAKAMARTPEDRFPDAESMMRALEPFANGSFVGSSSPRPLPQARGARGTSVAPREVGPSSVRPAFNVTRQVDELRSSSRAPRQIPEPPPLPAPASRAPRSWQPSPLPDSASSAPRRRPSPPPASVSGPPAPRPRKPSPGQRSAMESAMESTLRTSTPFASESLESPRIRESGWFARPATRWLMAGCLLAILAYAAWQTLSESELFEAEAPRPTVPQPSAATAQLPAEPSASAPTGAAAAASAELPASAAPASKVGPAAPAQPTGLEARPQPTLPEAPGLRAGLHRSSAAPVLALHPRSSREAALRVGEAAPLEEGHREPSQPSAASTQPANDTKRQDATEAVKPAPVRRPNPALDRTQF